MKLTKQCYECKQQFRREELVEYCSDIAITPHSYCPKCLQDKQMREKFAAKVCSIFGVKSPGPRIWTERKRIQNKYGYTDDTIIDCLEYIYDVENCKKIAESLCLITPATVDRMLQFKRTQDVKSWQIINAMTTTVVEHLVPMKESKTDTKDTLNPDEWLEG